MFLGACDAAVPVPTGTDRTSIGPTPTRPVGSPSGSPEASATRPPAPSPTPEPPDLTTSSYTPDPAPAKAAGTLTVADWQFPEAINPYEATSVGALHSFAALSFNGLLAITHDLRYVPDLAASVPLLENGDVRVVGEGMEVTWRLKPGMKWSDGQRITCTDLIATWRWNVDPARTRLAEGTAGWDEVTAIDTASETECIVSFRRPYEAYLGLFAPVLPSHHLDASRVERSAPYPLTVPAAGVYSGPYVPVTLTAGKEVRFEPNPFWASISGHPPALEGIVFRYFASSDAVIAAYRDGAVQLAAGLTSNDLPGLSAVPQNQLVARDSLTYELLAFNNRRLAERLGPEWQPVVRALMAAVDRDAVAGGPMGGAVQPINNPVSPLAWYHVDVGPVEGTDPDAAASALDGLGWARGADGIRVKEGRRLELDLCTTMRQDRTDIAALVAIQLERIGARINVLVRPSLPDMFGAWEDVDPTTPCNTFRGNFDIALHSYTPGLDPLVRAALYVSTASPDQPPHTGQNETRVNLPALDSAFATIRGSVDFRVIREAMTAFQNLYGSDENAFELPLFFRRDVWLAIPTLHNFIGSPIPGGGSWNVGDWWLEAPA